MSLQFTGNTATLVKLLVLVVALLFALTANPAKVVGPNVIACGETNCIQLTPSEL